MFQLHVILDQPRNWLDYAPSWVTAVAALVTVFVAIKIAINQNRLQKNLGERQLEIQARQILKDLFDRRYAIYVELIEFIDYVGQQNGRIQLQGPGQYRAFYKAKEKAEMLFGDDLKAYFADVDETARELYAVAAKIDRPLGTSDPDVMDRFDRLFNRITIELRPRSGGLFRRYLDMTGAAIR